MRENSNYFFCYSINLLRAIKLSGKRYIVKGVNPTTNRTFWLFEKDEVLDQVLSKWK